jgi:hypothetical protein
MINDVMWMSVAHVTAILFSSNPFLASSKFILRANFYLKVYPIPISLLRMWKGSKCDGIWV